MWNIFHEINTPNASTQVCKNIVAHIVCHTRSEIGMHLRQRLPLTQKVSVFAQSQQFHIVLVPEETVSYNIHRDVYQNWKEESLYHYKFE